MGRDDYDDKPSWRDIDRRREASTHTDQNKPSQGYGGPRHSSNRYYKAKLEKLMKEKLEAVFVDPEQGAASKKIINSVTGADRKEATAEYLDKWGVPEDFETLMAMAEVKDDAVFAQVLPPMRDLWDEQSDSRRKLARQLLQMRLMRVRDKDARATATELIGKE